MRFALVIPVFITIAAFSGSAQTSQAQSGLREGVRVRVSVPAAPRVTGVVQSVTPDSIILFAEPGGTRFGIARSSVQLIQVSQGRSASAGAKKGAVWGAAVFGGLGTVLAIALASDPSYAQNDVGFSPAAFAAITIAEGAVIGAIIGGFVKSEKWESVSVSPAVSMGSNGFRLGLRIR